MTHSSEGGGTGEGEASDGWLPHDGPDAARSDAKGAEDAAPGARAAAHGGTGERAEHGRPDHESPWLRSELSEGDEAAAARPPRDAAWLEPELTPADAPTEAGRDEADHDTGVPATLVEPPSQDTGARDTAPRAPADTPVMGAGHGDGPGGGPHDERRADAGRDTGDPDGGARPQPVGALSVLGAAVKELAIVVGMALVLSFVVKTWLLQAFYIPSGSMEDTLRINDRVIVSKLTPGPIDLKRGDIVVFADPGDWLEPVVEQPHGTAMTVLRDAMMFIGLLPDNSENHLIKRVIGLPGDHVRCCDEGGRITVNGAPIKEPYLMPGDAASESDFDITVPRGRVWVMGDHRSDSSDSRFHDAPENNGTQGSVDERLIVGRAVAIVWPLDHLTWLSNPTHTFAKVPNPAPAQDQGGAPDSPGEPAAGGDAPPPGDAPPGGGD